MKIIWILFLTVALVGCSKQEDMRKAAMLKKFAEIDSNFVAAIAKANSNELADFAREEMRFSNSIISLQVSTNDILVASNELYTALDRGGMKLFMFLNFSEQATRAERSAATNRMLLAKLNCFYTNAIPKADDILSNDITEIVMNITESLSKAREMDVTLAGLNQMARLLEKMTNAPSPRAAAKYKMAPERAAPVSQRTINSIPADIYAGIKADAVRKWPRDYDMQAYEIKTQCEAYLKVNP